MVEVVAWTHEWELTMCSNKISYKFRQVWRLEFNKLMALVRNGFKETHPTLIFLSSTTVLKCG